MVDRIHPETREAMKRAIRRLNVLEWILLSGAALLALVGGALVALFLQAALGFPFRLSWAVCSILFFVLPGGVVLGREVLLRRRREAVGNRDEKDGEEDGG